MPGPKEQPTRSQAAKISGLDKLSTEALYLPCPTPHGIPQPMPPLPERQHALVLRICTQTAKSNRSVTPPKHTKPFISRQSLDARDFTYHRVIVSDRMP